MIARNMTYVMFLGRLFVHNEFMESLEKLIEKYNRPGPRYTSYPPVPFWSDAPDEKRWIHHIQKNYSPETGIDLYVHVPYCEKLCFYCGCNRTITKNHDVEDPYLKMVLKEWSLYREKLGFTPKINSLHFGGGTPTFLSPSNLKILITELTAEKTKSFIGSIEIDPRTCNDEHLKVLAETGISRVSLGIQDFDPVVQNAINRVQPVELVEKLVEKLRALNFTSINFDLIYGLPKQSLKTIATTIDIVSKLKPDLIAFYAYAHLPEKIKNQRLINNDDLPSATLRRQLYESGKAILKECGYDDIGMDHFALPGSYLAQAKQQNNLHRNFMGYVDKKSSVLIGLGPTSISDSSGSFVQNAKEIDDYKARVAAGKLPITSGHTHTSEDLIVQEIILTLMCQGEVSFNEHVLPDWNEIRDELTNFANDGIINFNSNHLSLTKLGKPFMRNVAMSFDYHLRRKSSAVKFSQTI